MEHHSVEDRIRQLERRLNQVERAPRFLQRGGWMPLLKERDERIRFIGWALVAFSLIAFISGWGSTMPLVGLLLASVLMIGVVAVLSASGFISHSDSYLQLAQEALSGKRLHANAVHHRASNHRATANLRTEHWAMAFGFLLLAMLIGWALTLAVSDPLIQVGLPALVLAGVGVWAATQRKRTFALGSIAVLIVLLFVATDSLTALMAGLAAFAVIWIAAWESKDIDILSLAGFGLTLTAFGQVYWGIDRLTDPSRLADLAAALMGMLLVALPYAVERRNLERRDISRLSIIFSPLLALCVVTVAGPYTYLDNILVALLLVVVGYGALGFVSWLGYQRLSYAKYFLSAATAALLLFIYLVLDPVSVALIWFVLALGVTTAGFVLPSYSARLAGLGLLAIAVLHYLLTVFAADQVIGPTFLRDRVWLGIVFGFFLPALGLWYLGTRTKGVEKQLGPIIANSLSATSFLIFFGLGFMDVMAPYQSLAWLTIALAAIGFGRYTGLSLITKAGTVLIIFAVIKLLAIDIFSFSLGARLLVLLLVAVLLIFFGTVLPKYDRHKAIL